jgi:hypothetical protein
MIKILNEFTEYNLNLDSKPSDMTDGLDFVAFILDCEKYYNFEINDDEAIFIETENLTFLQIEDFFIFLRDGYATPFIYNLIVKNINELKSNRPDYEKYIINHRDNKLNDLLN